MVGMLMDGGALLPIAEGTTVSFQLSIQQGVGKRQQVLVLSQEEAYGLSAGTGWEIVLF